MMNEETRQDAAVAETDKMVAAVLNEARPKVVVRGDIIIAAMPDGRVESYKLSRRIRYGRREPVVGREQAAA